MNRFECIGRITKDFELETSANGVHFVKFSVAVGRKYKDENGDRQTDFFNCVAWRSLAENIEKFCGKGSKVFIAGELQNRCWENEEGEKKYFTEISVDTCEFLETKQKDSKPDMVEIDNSENDLPF